MGILTAELRKIFTTRMWWGLALTIFLLAFAISMLFGFMFGSNPVSYDQNMNEVPMDHLEVARSVYTGQMMSLTLGYILALVGGALVVGTDARYRTLTSTFLAEPRRARVMIAKVLAILTVGLVLGLAYLLGSFSGGAIPLAMNDISVFPEPLELGKTFLGCGAVIMLWCLFGVGLGILLPNPLWSTIVGVSLALIVEPIVTSLMTFSDVSWLSTVSKYMPSNATMAVTGLGDLFGMEILPWWGGILTMLAYAAVAALIGMLFTTNRDVN